MVALHTLTNKDRDRDKAVIVLCAYIPLIDPLTYRCDCKFPIFIAHFCKEFLS